MTCLSVQGNVKNTPEIYNNHSKQPPENVTLINWNLRQYSNQRIKRRCENERFLDLQQNLWVNTWEQGSYVVSQDIFWFETMYGKCLHKRTNQRSNHYMRGGGVTGNTTYLGRTVSVLTGLISVVIWVHTEARVCEISLCLLSVSCRG